MAAVIAPVFPDGPDARRHRITARVAGTHLDELEARVEAGEFRNLSHAIRFAIAELLDDDAGETNNATDCTDDTDAGNGTTPNDD